VKKIIQRASLKNNYSILFIIPVALLMLSCKSTELQQIASSIQEYQQPLDTKTVVAGLKQALEVGTKNSINKTSQKNGFNNNSLIHIAIPKELKKVESTLRKVGLGKYVDHFEKQMNRSAESASKEARAIFINSISQMSLTDGWGILRGNDDAATQYFKRTTSDQLSQKFKPLIKKSMNQVGFYSDYRKLLQTYNSISFTNKPNLNIEDYILQKTLSGIFVSVAQEEAKIRKYPSARVTQLLKRVFK
jgi:hypothetical protein